MSIRSSLTVALTALLLAGALAPASADEPAWIGSIKDAEAQSQASGKPIVLYLHADYCVYCRVLESTVFTDSRMLALLGSFVPCKLDGEHAGKDQVKQYAVQMYPYVAVLDGTGALVARPGDLIDADKYVKTLASNTPQSVVDALKAHPQDAPSLAELAVIEASTGEPGNAESTLTTLRSLSSTPIPNLLAPAEHALGQDYVDAKTYDKAVPLLEDAVASLGDVHEAVALRFRLIDCYTALKKPTNAQCEAIRKMRAASKNEKKQAEKREKDLLPR